MAFTLPYTLRHTFAKSLTDAGETEVKVATLLGHPHTSLETTRIDSTPTEPDLVRAVKTLAD